MRLRILAALSLLLLALTLAWPQSADEFFHRGAQLYLAGTNDMAKQAVTNGLRLFPNDPKLTNLWELLNRKGGQQQQQQQQNQDSKDQNKEDPQSKDSQDQDQQKKEQQKKEQQKKDEERKKKEEEQKAADQKKKEDEEKQGQQGSPDKEDSQDEKDGTPEAAKAMRMTPQQAMQFLDMLKSEEKNMPFRPILRTNRVQRVFKDW